MWATTPGGRKSALDVHRPNDFAFGTRGSSQHSLLGGHHEQQEQQVPSFYEPRNQNNAEISQCAHTGRPLGPPGRGSAGGPGAGGQGFRMGPGRMPIGPSPASYAELPRYQYAGEGGALSGAASGLKKMAFRRCWYYVGGCLFMVLGLCCILTVCTSFSWLWPGEPSFDCDAGATEWQAGWSDAKKTWCCASSHKGCEGSPGAGISFPVIQRLPLVHGLSTTTTTYHYTTTQSQQFNCDAGLDNTAGWSSSKVAWCCLTYQKGCPRTTTTVPFDCWAGYANWRIGWSRDKKNYCCDRQRVACPPGVDPPMPEQPSISEYNCMGGKKNGYAGWSTSKKAWCCEYKGRGCPTTVTTTTLPPTTTTITTTTTTFLLVVVPQPSPPVLNPGALPVPVPFVSIQAGLAKQQQQQQQVAPLSPGDPLSCEVECVYKAESSSCRDRVKWLMNNREQDCGVALDTVYSECQVCQPCSFRAACEQAAPYDCDAGLDNFKAGWSHQKKVWCCDNEQKGCQVFECDAGLDNWRKGWSIPKKAWCCTNEKKGCAYDCDAGYDNWRRGWSISKKQWCCAAAGRGCEQPDPDYDCDVDFDDWVNKWDLQKKSLCCSQSGRGCPPAPLEVALR